MGNIVKPLYEQNEKIAERIARAQKDVDEYLFLCDLCLGLDDVEGFNQYIEKAHNILIDIYENGAKSYE